MIDAYTIGVTLALEDGVSDGLTAIKRELKLLDRAIEQSTAGLNELYRLGQKVGAVMEAPPGAPPVPPVRATQQESTEGSPAPDHHAQMPGTRAPVTVAPQFAPPPRHTTRLNPDTIAPPSASLAQPVDKVQPSTQSPAQPPLSPGSSAPKTSVSRPNPASPTSPIKLQQFAPRLPPGRQVPETPLADTGVTSPPPDSEDREVPRSVAARIIPDPIWERDPAPTPNAIAPPPFNLRIATDSVEPLAIRGSSPLVPSAPKRSNEKPPHLAYATAAIPSLWHPGAKASEPPEPPATGNVSSHSGHVSGDFMIDGARLGRWIGEMLTSALNRPAAGMTGVDPRAMPTWPTMQGR